MASETRTAMAHELLRSVKEGLPDVLKRLDATADLLPSAEEFLFLSLFQQFKLPLLEIEGRMETLLKQLEDQFGRATVSGGILQETAQCYVAVQDALLEQVDGALDRLRACTEEPRKRKSREEKRIQAPGKNCSDSIKMAKMATPGGGKRSYMGDAIFPRPQDNFPVKVDNSNTPFPHPRRITEDGTVETMAISPGTVSDACRDEGHAGGVESVVFDKEEEGSSVLVPEKSGKKSRAPHPLRDQLKALKCDDGWLLPVEPQEPLPLESTPCTFIDTLEGLQKLALKLHGVTEIAVDLEHHQFHSFQGFTCTIQLSTRSEDFIIDTLALRSHIGPTLGKVFLSSSVRKVMHGADKDIVWLQRDFGIYLCNLFDTGQASRVLQMPSNGLSFLLQNFCNVTADKSYQLADWRTRPLLPEMLSYARQDTHYLLFIQDRLRRSLISARVDGLEDPVLKVFDRSRDVCLKVYEKDLLTDTSHLFVHGLHGRQLSHIQLQVLKELYAWRDKIARAEDESTGSICPNKLLIQLAEMMPDTRDAVLNLTLPHRALMQRCCNEVAALISKTKKCFFYNSQHVLEEAQDSLGTGKERKLSNVEENGIATLSRAEVQEVGGTNDSPSGFEGKKLQESPVSQGEGKGGLKDLEVMPLLAAKLENSVHKAMISHLGRPRKERHELKTSVNDPQLVDARARADSIKFMLSSIPLGPVMITGQDPAPERSKTTPVCELREGEVRVNSERDGAHELPKQWAEMIPLDNSRDSVETGELLTDRRLVAPTTVSLSESRRRQWKPMNFQNTTHSWKKCDVETRVSLKDCPHPQQEKSVNPKDFNDNLVADDMSGQYQNARQRLHGDFNFDGASAKSSPKHRKRLCPVAPNAGFFNPDRSALLEPQAGTHPRIKRHVFPQSGNKSTHF